MKKTVIGVVVLGLMLAWPVYGQNESTEVGWISDNGANFLWNDAAAGTYAINAWVKTEGVNIDPADNDAKIGVVYLYNDVYGTQITDTLWADQTSANTSWTNLEGVVVLINDPEQVFVKLIMGMNATGKVYFDGIGSGAGPFNGSAEEVAGFLSWYGGKGNWTRVTDTDAHGGDYSVEMVQPDTMSTETELVYYSRPYAVEAGEWYKIGVWIKTEGVIDSTGDHGYKGGYISTTNQNERVSLCYFFHAGPDIPNSFDPLVGGDKFIYADQTTDSTGWTHYQVAEQAPATATGISVRPRFNHFTTGRAFFDDITVEKITVTEANLLVNGDFEDTSPAFWSPLNATIGTEVDVTEDTSKWGFNSFTITKSAVSTTEIGWISDNGANFMWNNAEAGTYAINAWVKTEGVNIDPADNDAKIGVVYLYNDVYGTQITDTLWADQTSANTSWTNLEGVVVLINDPEQVFVKLIMGMNATGKVYFDGIGSGAGPFNGSAEEVAGFLSWYGGKGNWTRVTDTDAHGGDYSVEMVQPDTMSTETELVYYSRPYAVEAGEWYKIGVWIKTEGVIDSTGDHGYKGGYISTTNQNERVSLCYFFHAGPDIPNSFDPLVGGDKFIYADQTTDSTGWTHYQVAEQAPATATGISVRPRFNHFTTGRAFFDDITVEKITVTEANLLVNGDFEDTSPAFWSPLNATIGTEVSVTEDTSKYGFNSFMITTVGVSSIEDGIAQIPTEYQLAQNYPNPFNPETNIQFSLPQTGLARMDVYNILGQRVATLVDGLYQAGVYNINWRAVNDYGQPIASGIYFYTLMTSEKRITKKMLLLR